METSRKDWLAWRKQGIGSSDAAVIHEVEDSFMTPLQLWGEKLSTDLSEKPESWAMRQGNEYEVTARVLFSAVYNMENGTEETFNQSWHVLPDLEIIRGSLDGLSEDKETMTEFKFQGLENHLKVSDESLPIRGGRVPEKYWMQCQHGLLASGAKRCFFVSYNPKEPKNVRFVEILPDEKWLEKHIELVAKWWKKHILGQVPPPETDRDYVRLNKKGATGLAKKLFKLKIKEKKLKADIEDARTRILELADAAGYKRLVCGDLKIYKSEKAGSIEYKNIPAVKAMKPEELEQYRKSGSSYWTIDMP